MFSLLCVSLFLFCDIATNWAANHWPKTLLIFAYSYIQSIFTTSDISDGVFVLKMCLLHWICLHFYPPTLRMTREPESDSLFFWLISSTLSCISFFVEEINKGQRRVNLAEVCDPRPTGSSNPDLLGCLHSSCVFFNRMLSYFIPS